MRRTPVMLVCALLSGAGLSPGLAGVLDLPLGDPERRHRRVPVVVDAVTDSRTGELLTPAELARRIADARLVLVGENHTDVDFHRAQLSVIKALDEAGREVMIGLEMFPYTEQEYLDGWVRGDFTEDGFLRRSRWYEHWGANWNYYRDFFTYARANGLPMIALNTPREIVSKVRREGFDALSETEAEHVPREVDTDSEEHMRLFKAYFEDDEEGSMHTMMSEEQWQGMLRAQCTWDATMGHNAVKALAERGGPDSVLVVLVGSGHLAYGLGIQRQIASSFRSGVVSVIPVSVRDENGQPIGEIQASYTDFVWGLPRLADPAYPSLGISTPSGDASHRNVINVQKDFPGAAAGIEVGDVLLTMDGEDLATKGDLARLVAGKSWGDSAQITVRRGDEDLALEVLFRRTEDQD